MNNEKRICNRLPQDLFKKFDRTRVNLGQSQKSALEIAVRLYIERCSKIEESLK